MEFVKTYFNAEKAESLVFFFLGIVAVSTAAWFYFLKNDAFFRGAAWPLAIIGLIQLSVGSNIYFRSPKDMQRVENLIKNDPAGLQNIEIPRMEQVMKQFTILRWTEVALIATGLCLAFFFNKNPFWRGIGIGLTVQAAAMLVADYYAETRGHVYLDALKNFFKK